MKRILFLIAIILSPIAVSAADCSYIELENYRKELNNVSFELEYIPKGTVLETDDIIVDEQESILDYYKLDFTNIPSNLTLSITENGFMYTLKSNSTYVNSGVSTITIFSEECSNPVKTFDILIPKYNPDNKENKWFDGTYENNIKNDNPDTLRIVSIRLIIILVILSTSIIIMLIIFKKKGIIKWKK